MLKALFKSRYAHGKVGVREKNHNIDNIYYSAILL